MAKQRKPQSLQQYIAELSNHDHAICSVESHDGACFLFFEKPKCGICGAVPTSESHDGIFAVTSDEIVDGNPLLAFAVGRSEELAREFIPKALAKFKKEMPAVELMVWLYASFKDRDRPTVVCEGRGLTMGRGFAIIAAPEDLPEMHFDGRDIDLHSGLGFVSTRDVVISKVERRVICCGLTSAEASAAHKAAVNGFKEELAKREDGNQ